jgi:CHAD domain-containing protein
MAGQEEAVHQIRVASRRLRVILPLAAVKPKGQRMKHTLRRLKDLARVAGASRDLDVALSLLPAEGSRHAPMPLARAALARRLRAARSRARRRMVESLLDFDIAGLRNDLGRIVHRGGDELFTALMRVRLMREEEGAALQEELQRIGRRFDAEALHELRSRVRRLRYAAEFSAALTDSPPEAAKRFKEIQELLGEMHDAWVLAQWLGHQVDLSAKRGREEEAAEARRLAASCEDLSRMLHGKFLETDPAEVLQRALSLVGRTISVA